MKEIKMQRNIGTSVMIWKASVMEYHQGFVSWVTHGGMPQDMIVRLTV